MRRVNRKRNDLWNDAPFSSPVKPADLVTVVTSAPNPYSRRRGWARGQDDGEGEGKWHPKE